MSEMLTHLSGSRHTKAEGKFTRQICRSRIFVPANECTRVVPMYPSQSAMSHSLAQSMYIATFLPKHVISTCFADYVTSTSGAIRLAFDLLPLASSLRSTRLRACQRVHPGCSNVPCPVSDVAFHSLAPSMYTASFLPKHVIPTRFADYVTSTSGATRLAFDLFPLASSDAYPSVRLKAYISGG